MNFDQYVVTLVVTGALRRNAKAASPCGSAALENGGPYWTRTSDLFHVKETL